MLEKFKNKKILILGFGQEGIDTLRFLRRLFPNKVFGIADQNKNILSINKRRDKMHLGENYLKSLEDYDIIIKSPGIPIHLPEIEKAFKQGRITSQAEIFLKNCPATTIIGVTGTKGKGTTCSLIYQILKTGGRNAYLIGNIGKPVLTRLLKAKKNDVFIYELSSHQLYNLKKSPHIAVLLNIYPDHLDYYKNFREYVKTKANIVLHQTKNDYLIYNSQDKIVREFAKKSKAKKIPFFSAENIKAAIIIGKILGISDKKIAQAIKKFKPLLPHRLEYLRTYRGIKFYNDSASTIPEATIFALDALGDNVQTIFLGGSDKKVNFDGLAKRILKSKIKNIIFFPSTGEKIWNAIRLASLAHGKKLPRHFFVDNMKEAVKLAYQHTQKGKTCLLSCASASFGLFRDYKERGDLFKKWVKFYGSL